MKSFFRMFQYKMFSVLKIQQSYKQTTQVNGDKNPEHIIKHSYGTSICVQEQIKKVNFQQTKDRKIEVFAINGSHRQGNTQFMMQFILQELNKNPSFSTNRVNLREKSIDYCNAQDYQCPLTSNCSCCRDDMTQIFKLMESADLIIMASPTYFSNVSGRMKNMIDRCNPYRQNQKLAGKSVALISVGGSSQESVEQMIGILTPWINLLSMKIIATYFTMAQKPNGVAKSEKSVAQLKQLVGKIQLTFED